MAVGGQWIDFPGSSGVFLALLGKEVGVTLRGFLVLEQGPRLPAWTVKAALRRVPPGAWWWWGVSGQKRAWRGCGWERRKAFV